MFKKVTHIESAMGRKYRFDGHKITLKNIGKKHRSAQSQKTVEHGYIQKNVRTSEIDMKKFLDWLFKLDQGVIRNLEYVRRMTDKEAVKREFALSGIYTGSSFGRKDRRKHNKYYQSFDRTLKIQEKLMDFYSSLMPSTHWEKADTEFADRINSYFYNDNAEEFKVNKDCMRSDMLPLYCKISSGNDVLVFLDKPGGVGTLARITDETIPEGLMTTIVKDGLKGYDVVKLSDVYRDPGSVAVKHLYHESMDMRPDETGFGGEEATHLSEEAISEALKRHGFEKVEHIKLNDLNGDYVPRNILLEPRYGGEIEIFQKDLDRYLVIPVF